MKVETTDVYYGYTVVDGATFVMHVWVGDSIDVQKGKITVILRNGGVTETVVCTAKQVKVVRDDGVPWHKDAHVYRISRHGYMNREGEYLS